MSSSGAFDPGFPPALPAPEGGGPPSADAAGVVPSLYFELMRQLPVGVVILQSDDPRDPGRFRIVNANAAAGELLEATAESLGGKSVGEHPHLLKALSLACGGKTIFSARQVIHLKEGAFGDERIRHCVYALTLLPLPGNCFALVFENISEQKIAELAVRDSEERFRLLVQGVLEYAIFYLDPQGRVVSWNAGAERLEGYAESEIIGKHFSIFYPPEEALEGRPARRLQEAATGGQSEDEGWRMRKDGSRFWAHVVISALRDADGNLRGFAELTRDITDRRERIAALHEAKEELETRVEQRTADLAKVNAELRMEIAERRRAEEQLKASRDRLRALAARLQYVREEERIRIAREIHDELGQACTALKMDLALVARKLTKAQTQALARIKSAMELADGLIHSMRRIASELRPRALDDLGLETALQWQAQDFESRTKIPCNVILPQEPLTLDSDRSTAIFRIFQEALTNVARHSQATHVDARLWREQTEIVLQVCDNGKGFDSEEALARKSLGLLGMQERAILLHGTFRMESSPGQGTTVTLRIPVC